MKKQIISSLLVCAVALILAGCAGSRNTYSLVSAQFPQISAGQGRVYFYRWKEAIAYGERKNTKISLNDQKLGTLRTHCFFFADSPAGVYFVKCQTGLFDPKQGEHKLTFTLNAGETKYIRITELSGLITSDANPTLEHEEDAIKDLSMCVYTPYDK